MQDSEYDLIRAVITSTYGKLRLMTEMIHDTNYRSRAAWSALEYIKQLNLAPG